MAIDRTFLPKPKMAPWRPQTQADGLARRDEKNTSHSEAMLQISTTCMILNRMA